jgi:hypothetical protein
MTLAAGLALAGSTFALIVAPVAGATTYNNDTPIFIPAGGNANPYPSSITVSGTAAPITDINVGLDNYTSTSPGPVSMVLVAPTGLALQLMGCVADEDGTASGAFVTLDDSGGLLPDNENLTTGTYRPTSHCSEKHSFPAPGPLLAYSNPGPGDEGIATFANTFNGSSAIGTWNLFVGDFNAGDGGQIAGGWSLDVNPDVTPLPPVPPTPAPTSTKKKCKKAKKRAATAKKKRCKKRKRKK